MFNALAHVLDATCDRIFESSSSHVLTLVLLYKQLTNNIVSLLQLDLSLVLISVLLTLALVSTVMATSKSSLTTKVTVSLLPMSLGTTTSVSLVTLQRTRLL